MVRTQDLRKTLVENHEAPILGFREDPKPTSQGAAQAQGASHVAQQPLIQQQRVQVFLAHDPSFTRERMVRKLGKRRDQDLHYFRTFHTEQGAGRIPLRRSAAPLNETLDG
jgi:hypothetical protein